MRKILMTVVLAGAMIGIGENARAADGCSYDAYGRMFCLPGARPGVPYEYGGYYGGYGRGCYWERRRVWNGYRWRVRSVRVCN